MKKYLSHSFQSCLSFGALLLVALTARAQFIQYPPGNFDVEISFGCNCTCWCDTNNVDTNNPISVFLAANPPKYVYATSKVAPQGQVVPPHWTEFLPLDYPPYDPNALLNMGSSHPWDPEGWTVTVSTLGGFTFTSTSPYYIPPAPPTQPPPPSSAPVWLPVTYNPGFPVDFNLLFNFYATNLPPDVPNALPNGILPVQPQPPLSPMTTTNEPYPQDVNVTMWLANGQTYIMEQQLVVGYYPYEDYMPAFDTPVNYVETNSLLTISLYCTYGGVTNPMSVDYATITATLLTNNIPQAINQAVGYVSPADDLFKNWSWPLTTDDMPETPPDVNNSPGAAGTVQAQLSLGSGPIEDQPLLVRANRAYRLTLTYGVVCFGGLTFSNEPPLVITNTGVVPPCTNLQFVFYTTNCECSNSLASYCNATNIGLVDMMGTPDDPPGITVSASGGYLTTLTGLSPTSLPWMFQLPVTFLSPGPATFNKWATESLGTNTAYEYFSSPSVLVTDECNATLDLGDDFVMCPTNPAVVEGTVTLNGCVDTNYYGGAGALSFLQFAVYHNGLPYDPPVGPEDLTLANVSSIQATGGESASSAPVPSSGPGDAVVEFDNPGVFSGPNSFTGNYSFKLAGLESGESYWNANDLHLVFGDPVKLDYHVVETNSPYTNLDISCGTIVTNNIALCFGLATVGVTNLDPGIVTLLSGSLQVSGTGPGYTVGPFTRDFQFTLSPGNFANVPLFLPEGCYQAIAVAYGSIGGDILYVTNYFTVICCTNPCNCVPPPTNMVLWLPFDETAGSVSANIAPVPGANNGQQVGGPGVIWGAYVDNSLNFYGSQYVSVPDYSAIDPGTNQSFTLDAWVNRGTNGSYDSPAAVVLDKRDPANGDGYSLSVFHYNGYDQVFLTLSGNNYGSGTEEVPADGQWHFIAATVIPGSPGVGELYIDGLPPVAFTPANVNLVTSAPFVVGESFYQNGGNNHPWQGGIDEVEMYSRALEQSEIEGIYNAGPCGKCKPIVTNNPCLQVDCPTNIVVTSCTNVQVFYAQPTVTDLCCSNWSAAYYPFSGSIFTPDTTTPVTCLVYDDCGNSNSCSFTVMVVCPTNPPLPVIHPVNESGITNAIVFTLGAGNGMFTFTNNAWSVSSGNYNYILQYTTNLVSPNWMTVCNAIPTIGYTFTNASPITFYRLQLQTNQ